MLQSTRYKIIIYSLAAAILLVLLGFWLYFAQAQARDYQRLADLKVWQNILAAYYSRNGTYVIPNCASGELISQCLPQPAGAYRFTVASLSESDFGLNFSLEAGIAGLKPGQYIWTKNGVKR